MKKVFLTLFLFTTVLFATANQLTFLSPDKNLVVTISIKDDGSITYALDYKTRPVIEPSACGFVLSRPEVTLSKFTLLSADSSFVDENWKPVWGEVSTIRNNYRQLSLSLREIKSNILINLIFRVFNDGIGFRYEFPKQQGLDHFIISDELTTFDLAGDHKAFWIPGNYDSNEYAYNITSLSEIDAEKAVNAEPGLQRYGASGKNTVQTPLMMKTKDNLYLNIHEAALINFPAMYLLLNKDNFILNAQLVPDAFNNKAYLQTPAITPWRTILVSDKAADILISKMILNLNEPSVIADPSFIKPQKMLGVWWELHINKSKWQLAGGTHGANTTNVKHYIDFAAKHNIEGVLVEGWNKGWEDWYGNWKENVFDFTLPYPDYDLQTLTAYAKQKNVKLVMHHETAGSVTNYERQMDTAYRFMLDHNMDLVKTGYVGKIIPRGEHHDGQWMVNHYQRVAEKTAKYKIMLDAHEPVRPTGLHRTYPNWLASEAARGNEFNAWSEGNKPEHETILPFTRLIGGPMDYTPGIFRMSLNKYDSAKKNRVHTTICKQLALYVVMYSPLQMVSDLPENYEKYPDAFKFIKDVPVDWDETQVLEAEPGDYITIARKQKNADNWFVGGITDENERTATIDCNFLDAGKKYQVIIYKDAPDADWQRNPEAYIIEKKMINSKTKLKIPLAPGGGFAMSLERM